jgi:hypothetical protein
MRSATFSMKLRQPEKKLRIYILGCDFSMLCVFERECLPLYKLGWQTSNGGIASACRLQEMTMDALRERRCMTGIRLMSSSVPELKTGCANVHPTRTRRAQQTDGER